MSGTHWTDKQQETIEDKCRCGAVFIVKAQYPASHHSKWLLAHKICRTRAEGEDK